MSIQSEADRLTPFHLKNKGLTVKFSIRIHYYMDMDDVGRQARFLADRNQP